MSEKNKLPFPDVTVSEKIQSWPLEYSVRHIQFLMPPNTQSNHLCLKEISAFFIRLSCRQIEF